MAGQGGSSSNFAIGAHALVRDNQGLGVNPMTTLPVDTHDSGSTFVLFVGGIDSKKSSVSDSKGNSYAQVGSWVSYASGQGYGSAYICAGCTGGAGHTFSFNKDPDPPGPTNEAVLFAIEVLGAPSLESFAQADSLTNPISAGTVTTKRAGDLLLLMAFGAAYNQPDNYTPSTGYTLVDEQPYGSDSTSGADAYQIAGPPGTYGGSLESSQTNDPGLGSAVFLLVLGK